MTLIVNEGLKAYSKRLVSEEMQIIGRGAFSHVFEHPQLPNVVAKLVSARDKNYQRYIAWSQRHLHNPFVPTVLDMIECKAPRERYFIVFLEKLTNFRTDKSYVHHLAKAIGCLTQAEIDRIEKHLYYFTFPALYRMLDRIITSKRCKNVQLKEVWNFLALSGFHRLDLHRGNVMLRGKQLIFTDPIAEAPRTDLRLDN